MTTQQPTMKHVGECEHDQSARDVCEAIYAERCDDNLALCEALRAVLALVGEDPQIQKIVNDAISQHGLVGEA